MSNGGQWFWRVYILLIILVSAWGGSHIVHVIGHKAAEIAANIKQ